MIWSHRVCILHRLFTQTYFGSWLTMAYITWTLFLESGSSTHKHKIQYFKTFLKTYHYIFVYLTCVVHVTFWLENNQSIKNTLFPLKLHISKATIILANVASPSKTTLTNVPGENRSNNSITFPSLCSHQIKHKELAWYVECPFCNHWVLGLLVPLGIFPGYSKSCSVKLFTVVPVVRFRYRLSPGCGYWAVELDRSSTRPSLRESGQKLEDTLWSVGCWC